MIFILIKNRVCSNVCSNEQNNKLCNDVMCVHFIKLQYVSFKKIKAAMEMFGNQKYFMIFDYLNLEFNVHIPLHKLILNILAQKSEHIC